MKRLIVILEGQEQSYPVSERSVILGRLSSNDIQVNESSVSRQHASVNVKGDFLVVKDLGSKNGIKINDHRIDEGVVKHNEYFLMGKVPVYFQTHDEALPPEGAPTNEDGRRPTSSHEQPSDEGQRTPLDIDFQPEDPEPAAFIPERESKIEDLPHEPVGADPVSSPPPVSATTSAKASSKKVMWLSVGLATSALVLVLALMQPSKNNKQPAPQTENQNLAKETELFDSLVEQCLKESREYLEDQKKDHLQKAEKAMRQATRISSMSGRRLNSPISELIFELKRNQKDLANLDLGLISESIENIGASRYATVTMKEHVGWFSGWIEQQQILHTQYLSLIAKLNGNIDDKIDVWKKRYSIAKDDVFWPEIEKQMVNLEEVIENHFLQEIRRLKLADDFMSALQQVQNARGTLGDRAIFNQLKQELDALNDGFSNLDHAEELYNEENLNGALLLLDKVPIHPKFNQRKTELKARIDQRMVLVKARELYDQGKGNLAIASINDSDYPELPLKQKIMQTVFLDKQARQALAKKNYRQAQKAWRDIIELNKYLKGNHYLLMCKDYLNTYSDVKVATIYYQDGLRAMKDGDYATARNHFDQAESFQIGIARSEIDTIVKRARSLYSEGRRLENDGLNDQAKDLFREALDMLRSDDPKGLFYEVEKTLNK